MMASIVRVRKAQSGRIVRFEPPGRGWIVPVVGEAAYQDALRSVYRKNGGDGHDLKVGAVLTPELRRTKTGLM